MNTQETLKDQFLKVQQQDEPKIPNADSMKTGSSRLLIFYLDALDEFETRRRSTAPCLYAILFSLLLGILAAVRQSSENYIPVLELVFLSSLIMFVINFQLLVKSDILPFIQDRVLNNTLKKTAVSIIVCIVFFALSVKQRYSRFIHAMGSFVFYVGHGSVLLSKNIIIHKLMTRKKLSWLFQHNLKISYGGMAFALGVPQLLLTNPGSVEFYPILWGLLSGTCLVYTGEKLKSLQHQNIFTITHVIGLFSIILTPIFFSLEKLKQPTLLDWIFFVIVACAILFCLPMLIKAFTMEKQSLIIHYLGWSVPFYRGLLIIFTGHFPSIFELAGGAALIIASLVLLSFQRVRLHSGSFFIEKEKDNPDRPKNQAELQLWKTSYMG